MNRSSNVFLHSKRETVIPFMWPCLNTGFRYVAEFCALAGVLLQIAHQYSCGLQFSHLFTLHSLIYRQASGYNRDIEKT